MDLDFSCVESFVVLADTQHFGHAATRLHLSGSALSKRLVHLEHQLGARLVDRDSGGFIELTPAGERLLAHSGAVLRSAREARRAVLDGKDAPVVRLGIPGSPADHFVPSAWSALEMAYVHTLPGTRLQACGVPYGKLEESLLTGRVDLLLSTGEFDHSSLIATPVMLARRVVLLPVEHELVEQDSVRCADLADLPLVREATASSQWMGPWLLGDLRSAADTPVVDIRARTLVDVQRLILAGRAATIASATIGSLIHPGLVALPVDDLAPTPAFVVHRRRNEREEVLVARQTLIALFAAIAAVAQKQDRRAMEPVPLAPQSRGPSGRFALAESTPECARAPETRM